MYLEHYSTKSIAKIFNDAGIPTRENSFWDANTVNKILKNKLYLGIYELGKKGGKARRESPIMENLRFLDEKTFYEVQDKIAENRKKGVGYKRATVRGSKLLSGLLYCECGEKYTGHTYKSTKLRKDGTELVYEHNFYRCGSHRHPMEGQCEKKPYSADRLDRIIIDDAKRFLLETDINKLLVNHEEKIKEKEQELAEQMRRLTKEKTQMEKELQKLKEEVCKVIMGESQFSQSLLTELIQAKENELAELRRKHEEAETRVNALKASLKEQRAVCSGLNDWTARFDMQGTAEKKSMLINLINRVTVYDEEIEVKYSIRFDKIDETEYYNKVIGGNDNDSPAEGFSCQGFAQRGTQSRLDMFC